MADNDSEALACTQDRPTPSADPSEPPLPDVASGLDRPKSPADDKDLHNYIDRYLTENEVKPEHADALKAQIATDLGDWGQANKDLIGRLVDEHFQRAPQGNAPGPVRSNVDSGGDPVELFSGELAYSVTDFVLAGAGIDFQFTRTYRNQVRFDGPLGVNWTHAYHLQLWESPDRQRLILSTGELRELTYTRHPRWDYYVPPDGDHAVLTEAGASFERREPDGLRHVFEPDPAWTGGHRLSRVEDANGNYLALSYVDDQLTLVEVNHPQRTVDFGYDVAGRIDRITDHTGRTWRYGYDDFGDLIYFTTPSTEHARNGLTTCYEYSTGNAPVALGHNLIRVTDPNGESYLDNDYGQDSGVYAYNRVIRQRQGGGETLLEYERVVSGADDDGYPEHQRPAWQTNEIDPLGHPVHRVYNAYGNLLLREESVTRAGHVRLLRWRYRYNADGNLTAELSPLGALTQYYYGRDDYRRRYDVTDAEIAEHEELTARERQAFGDLLMVIRRRRRLDLEEMDLSRGVWGDIFPDVIAGRDPGDIVVRYSYDPDYHGLATVSDPRSGALTRYEYAGPRLIAVHEPTPTLPDGTSGGEVTTRYLEHDSRGRLLHSVDPVGVHTRYSYHDSGVRDGFPRTTIVDPDGFALTTMIEVDELGRAVAVHSPNAALTRDGRHVTRYRYNALDQLVETIGSPPFRYSTRRFYDPNGQLSRIERDNRDDSGGALASGPQTTVYEYDERLNLRREGQGGADPGTRLVVTHTYDAASRRTGTRLPEGNLVRHAYDERHRRIATTEGTGSPLAATSRTEWDDDDRPEVTISPLGHRTRVRFDVFGRLIEEIDPLGNVARFSYDEAGNLILTRIFEPTADGGHALLGRSEAHFDELNRSTVTVVNLFDGPYPVSSLDEEGPGTAGPGRRLTSQLYLDAAGRPVATVDPLGARTTYFHDTAGRLNETVDALGNRASHGYDPNGNLLRTDILEAADSGFRAFAIAYRYDELDR